MGEPRNSEPYFTVFYRLRKKEMGGKRWNSHLRGRCSPWQKSFGKVLSSVKRQPFQSTFIVIFSCEQSRGILPLGRNCCQKMMGRKNAYCWTLALFRSFLACSFLCSKPFTGIRIAKHRQHPTLALHTEVTRVGGLCPGPEGLSMLLKSWGGHVLSGHAIKKATLVPKTKEWEQSTSRWIRHRTLDKPARHRAWWGSRTQTLQSSTATAGMQVRLSTLKTSPEEQNRFNFQTFQFPLTTGTGVCRPQTHVCWGAQAWALICVVVHLWDVPWALTRKDRRWRRGREYWVLEGLTSWCVGLPGLKKTV